MSPFLYNEPISELIILLEAGEKRKTASEVIKKHKEDVELIKTKELALVYKTFVYALLKKMGDLVDDNDSYRKGALERLAEIESGEGGLLQNYKPFDL